MIGDQHGKIRHCIRRRPWRPYNQDSQIIEALKLNDKTIAGVFGVPGILVGLQDSAGTFSSTEALMSYWLSNGLGFLLDHIEVAFDQFFGLPAAEYVEYDTDALLRTAMKDRLEALGRGVQTGIFAPNEARAREGYGAVKAGDEPRTQQQMVPLSFAQLGSIPPVAGQPSPPSAAPAKPEDGEEDGEAEKDWKSFMTEVMRHVDENRTA